MGHVCQEQQYRALGVEMANNLQPARPATIASTHPRYHVEASLDQHQEAHPKLDPLWLRHVFVLLEQQSQLEVSPSLTECVLV